MAISLKWGTSCLKVFGAGPNNVVDTTVFGVAVSIVVFRHSILKVTRGHDPATDMLGGDMRATCHVEVDAVEHVLSLVLKECDNTRTAHPMVDTDCVSLYKLSSWQVIIEQLMTVVFHCPDDGVEVIVIHRILLP